MLSICFAPEKFPFHCLLRIKICILSRCILFGNAGAIHSLITPLLTTAHKASTRGFILWPGSPRCCPPASPHTAAYRVKHGCVLLFQLLLRCISHPVVDFTLFCISVIQKPSTGVFFLCVSNNSVNPLFCLREKRQPPSLKPPALRAVVTAPAQQKRRCFLLLFFRSLGSSRRPSQLPRQPGLVRRLRIFCRCTLITTYKCLYNFRRHPVAAVFRQP